MVTTIGLQTLHIAFDGHQVAVHSNAPEVLAGLTRSFQEMLATDSNGPVGQLEVWQKDGAYHIRGSKGVKFRNGSLADVLCCLRYEVALHLIQARPDLLWLHAGAVAYRGHAVIISGLSGRGKSTLATRLCTLGWTYLSDNIIPLDPTSDKILPFPQTPMVCEGVGQKEVPWYLLRELRKTEITLKPETVCRAPAPVGALIFPNYDPRSPIGLLSCSPETATLGLLENSLSFVTHREAAVRYLGKLMKRIPAFRLPFNNGDFAAELVTRVCQNGRLFEHPFPNQIRETSMSLS
jgi:hypothetical protein